MKQTFFLVLFLSLLSMNTVSFPQAVYAQSADGKVGLDDPRWDAVFESVDKSYKEELQKKAQRDAENERLRKNQETKQLLQEIEANNKNFEQKYKPFNSQPAQPVAQPQNDPYADMQRQMQIRQRQEAQQRAKQDAAQEAYQDQLIGRNQGSAGNSGSQQQSHSKQKPSGLTVNRSRAEGRDALTGKVEATQKAAPAVRTCECRGNDKVILGTYCAPQNYMYPMTMGRDEDWKSGLIYMPGQFACQ
ncbi:MAG: hypothetical protein HND56_07505 [Pseudomonadota bacterium]|nr:hypothetical protein [Pseudomonadota bacterium]QKK05537.1 MAG: hypothetical protein HND56_07505 [Pseudomonadota bacterium]